MPFIAFVDSVIFRNLCADPDGWITCPGTYNMAFLMAVALDDELERKEAWFKPVAAGGRPQ